LPSSNDPQAQWPDFRVQAALQSLGGVSQD
jgi:hypothetical protein